MIIAIYGIVNVIFHGVSMGLNISMVSYSYGHLLVITGYFNGIIHSINGVISTYNWYFGP